MSFSLIKGQDIAVRFLEGAIKNSRLCSAYIFHGPSGIGKELTAVEFAKAVCCETRKGDGCNTCNSCRKISEKTHADMSWIYPVGSSLSITIDQIRELQKNISWKPFESECKISFIVDADRMTEEAGNALLKVLEEPPGEAVFILITSLPSSLLPTIRSRAQDVQFFSMPVKIVAQLMQKQGDITEEESRFYSRLSGGSIGEALRLGDEDIFNRRKTVLDIAANAPFKGFKSMITWIKDVVDDIKNIREKLGDESGCGQRFTVENIFEIMLNWYRDVMVYKITQNAELVLNSDYIEKIKVWSGRLTMDQLEDKEEILKDAKNILSRNISQKLVIQVIFTKLGLI